jgi:hypothetical protein
MCSRVCSTTLAPKQKSAPGAFDRQQTQMPGLEQVFERGPDLPHQLERENVAGRMTEHQPTRVWGRR